MHGPAGLCQGASAMLDPALQLLGKIAVRVGCRDKSALLFERIVMGRPADEGFAARMTRSPTMYTYLIYP
jgi:hypothetical protein